MRRVLAWVFWHTRSISVPEADYRRRLLEFHELLAGEEIEGFVGSRILRYDAVPWLASATEVYEDWYLLRDSSALDRLDEAALDLRRRATHDAVARLAAQATAGLYRLRLGDDPGPIARCFWFHKPNGESYESFFARHAQLKTGSFGLWARQMVLGPTPEFVLTASAEVAPLVEAVTLVPESVR